MAINKAKNVTMSFWRRRGVPLEDYAETLAFPSPEAGGLFEKVMKLPEKYRLVLVCACTVLALGLAVTAYARGGLILGHVFGWGNNMEVTTGIDENGESYNEVRLHTENLTPPVVQRGGRMIFIVNNESIDITGELSPTKAFRYDYTDTDGNTHVWLVGLVSEDTANYGYAEYIKRSDGTWLGGCSVGVSLDADGRSSALWLESAKQELNIRW